MKTAQCDQCQAHVPECLVNKFCNACTNAMERRELSRMLAGTTAKAARDNPWQLCAMYLIKEELESDSQRTVASATEGLHEINAETFDDALGEVLAELDHLVETGAPLRCLYNHDHQAEPDKCLWHD